VCRALKVLCVAPDREVLAAVKRAAVSADWELSAGATDEPAALEQLESDRPHVVVVAGGVDRRDGSEEAAGSDASGRFTGFVAEARRRYPFLRIVADRPLPGATVVVTDLAALRGAIRGLPRPAGPIT
jgi:hypothetical protein